MTTSQETRWYELREQADRAEAHYDAVVHQLTGKTRWTLRRDQEWLPEIREAQSVMIAATVALLDYMQAVMS